MFGQVNQARVSELKPVGILGNMEPRDRVQFNNHRSLAGGDKMLIAAIESGNFNAECSKRTKRNLATC